MKMGDEEMKNSSSFFANRECEFFPCHKTAFYQDFNCLFCYCPLYALGARCGGNFKMTDSGIKDCSECMVPHRTDAAEYIGSRWAEIAAMIRNDRNKEEEQK